jgi:hypothetical protein
MVQLSATVCSCIAYFVSQSSEFCHHNPLCCFPTSVYCYLFRYRLSPDTFEYTLVCACVCVRLSFCVYTLKLPPSGFDPSPPFYERN